MRAVFVVGVGMTPFAKHLDRNIKSLAREALEKTPAVREKDRGAGRN